MILNLIYLFLAIKQVSPFFAINYYILNIRIIICIFSNIYIYWHSIKKMYEDDFMLRERIREICPPKIKREGTHAFFNGINMLLITRPERKIYLLSPRICDQGISASVLLRDENWKWDGTIGAAKDDTGVDLKVLLPMETFSRFECAADLKFISFFKGLFFCSRSRVYFFFFFVRRRWGAKT